MRRKLTFAAVAILAAGLATGCTGSGCRKHCGLRIEYIDPPTIEVPTVHVVGSEGQSAQSAAIFPVGPVGAPPAPVPARAGLLRAPAGCGPAVQYTPYASPGPDCNLADVCRRLEQIERNMARPAPAPAPATAARPLPMPPAQE